MKKNKTKKISSFVVSVIVILSIMSISIMAAEYTESHTYTLKDDWSGTIVIDYQSARGGIFCGYKNGALSAPKTTTETVGYGDCISVAASSYIIDGSGNRYEDTIYATYDTDELVVKAGFFDSPTETGHYGYIAGLFEDASGTYTGSK